MFSNSMFLWLIENLDKSASMAISAMFSTLDNAKNFLCIPKTQWKIQRTFSFFEIIAFEQVAEISLKYRWKYIW